MIIQTIINDAVEKTENMNIDDADDKLQELWKDEYSERIKDFLLDEIWKIKEKEQ